MDFDHRDGRTKRYTVGAMATRSWRTVAAEIAKCDVRCANCHVRRTAEMFKWRKAALVAS